MSIVPGSDARAAQLDHQPVASACAYMHCSGASPFSKREEASLRRPSAHEVRWMFGPFQLATSSSTRVVSGLDLRARAAHQPGDRGRALGVLDHDHLAVERARLAVERRAPARPSRARRTVSRAPATRSRSKACSGWPVSSIT